MTNKLSKCPRGAAILKNRKAAVGSWDLGTDLARLRKISDELTHRGRDPFNQNFRKFRSKTLWIGSIQPEEFSKKLVHLTFPSRTGLNFG